MEDFDQLLARSHEFSGFLLDAIDSAEASAEGERSEAVAAAAELVFEHAHALRVLFEAGTPNSAAAMLRLQYEALLRAGWLLYAATDDRLAEVSVPLTPESAEAAKNLPGADKMLKALERQMETSPNLRGLVMPLRELRDAGWHAMNAFVHCGFQAIARSKDGFPIQLSASVVKLSNGQLHMAARLLTRLTDSEELVRRMETSYAGFEDVLPVITPPAAQA